MDWVAARGPSLCSGRCSWWSGGTCRRCTFESFLVLLAAKRRLPHPLVVLAVKVYRACVVAACEHADHCKHLLFLAKERANPVEASGGSKPGGCSVCHRARHCFHSFFCKFALPRILVHIRRPPKEAGSNSWGSQVRVNTKKCGYKDETQNSSQPC